ncbi:helix-turn-helix domain-containing protein [Oceanobacillus kapialis]|uniref:Helix-turn-helix domain-containing protein n=1 Tax=Oceanobacillus kapialis TaxID=481353 RepID=A0ABW5PW52_9BACI
MEGLGLKLENLREKAGYTQKQMSYKLGYSENTFGKYERENMNPSLETLVKIADIFQVSLDSLLRDEEPTLVKDCRSMQEILNLLEKAGLKKQTLLNVNNWSLLSNEDLKELYDQFNWKVEQAAKKED